MNNIINRVWIRNRMVNIDYLCGAAFCAEDGGHTFQISGADSDGSAVALSGTVAGVFLRPDNTDVAITGSCTGGVVSVTLPANCYDVQGRFGLTIFLTSDDQKTAIYAAVGNVARTSSGAVAPQTTADVVDLINRISAAVATIPQNWPGLMADIAPTYSASAVYPAGAYVYYNGDLYRCTTAITTAETWTPAHWTTANLGTDLRDLKAALNATISQLLPDPQGRNQKTEIEALLASNGICILGPGDYYTSQVTMPENSSIIGTGMAKTIIHHVGSAGAAFKMNSNCCVEGVTILGNDSDIVLTGEIGEKVGIGWMNAGNRKGSVRNCRISRFVGAGIVFNNSGTDTDNNLEISDCYITNCEVGIFGVQSSGYHKISNCTIVKNYYGLLNRCGNCIISNCGFDSNVIGIEINADYGSNNGHGSITGCTINHSGNNEGYGLIIRDTGRMVVTGCQFYYSKIKLQHTNGNIISNCGFGNGGIIEIDAGAGNANTVEGCMFREGTPIVENSGSTKIFNNQQREGLPIQQNLIDYKRTKNLIRFDDESFETSKIIAFGDPLPPGTYTISGMFSVNAPQKIRVKVLKAYSTSNVLAYLVMNGQTNEKQTFTISEEACSIYISLGMTDATALGKRGFVKDLQIESGNSCTGYAPYYSYADERIGQIGDKEVELYTDFASGYIDTSGDIITPTPVADQNFGHIKVPCKEGDVFSIQAKGGNASRLLYIFCDDEMKIITRSSTMPEGEAIVEYTPSTKYVAPCDAKYLIVNHQYKDQGFSPVVYKLSTNALENYLDSRLPYIANPEWKSNVITAYKSMIAVKIGSNILLSKDCGKTWGDPVGISEITATDYGIRNAHLYSNGTIAIFTDTKAYYIDDGDVCREAICYESDGRTIYEPSDDQYNFNSLWDHAERMVVNDKDAYVFSNYNLGSSNQRNIIWYSIDYGHSYKIAYEFGTRQSEEGSFDYTVRHIHDVLYWANHNLFIVTTGDSNATECMVFKLIYNASNDEWTIEKIGGSSRAFKWSNIALWNEELYYCLDNTPGRVLKTSFDNIADLEKHVIVLDGMENDALNICFGNRGDVIITQSTSRNTAGQTIPSMFTPQEACRIAYYSSNRKDFNEVLLPITLLNYDSLCVRPKPTTTDGHIFIGSNKGTNMLPSICLDDIVRRAGYQQSFGLKI